MLVQNDDQRSSRFIAGAQDVVPVTSFTRNAFPYVQPLRATRGVTCVRKRSVTFEAPQLLLLQKRHANCTDRPTGSNQGLRDIVQS